MAVGFTWLTQQDPLCDAELYCSLCWRGWIDADWKDQKVESWSTAVVEPFELVEPNEWLNTKTNYTPLFDPFLYTVILALSKVCRTFITRDDIRYNRINLSCVFVIKDFKQLSSVFVWVFTVVSVFYYLFLIDICFVFWLITLRHRL